MKEYAHIMSKFKIVLFTTNGAFASKCKQDGDFLEVFTARFEKCHKFFALELHASSPFQVTTISAQETT